MKQYTYKEAKAIMIEYLLYKLSVDDFHAVADASMDIRELDAVEKSIFPQS